jgi:hypothetical protein
MGDLIPYYITLIEALSNYHSHPSVDVKPEVIGYVSSADFSLAQLPLVKLTQNRQSEAPQIFSSSSSSSSDYEFPCSVFAGIHIYSTGYIVPLNKKEKDKLKLWNEICNYSPWLNLDTFYIISKFKAYIDIIYSLYYGDINQLNDQLTNIRSLLSSYLNKNKFLNIDENTKRLLDYVPSMSATNSDQLVDFYLDMAKEIKGFNQSDISPFPLIDFLCDDLIQLCGSYKFFTQRLNSQSGISNYQLLLEDVCRKLQPSQSYSNFTIKKDNVKLYVVADYCVQPKDIFGGRPQKSRKLTLKNKNQNKKTYNKKTHNKKIRGKMNKTLSNKKLNKKHTNTLRKK